VLLVVVVAFSTKAPSKYSELSVKLTAVTTPKCHLLSLTVNDVLASDALPVQAIADVH